MKILVADDHPLTLQGTVSFVESYGYQADYICSNGTAALRLIELHLPDVAILDINMPGLDGIDVAQKVQQSRLRTRIILLTMHNEKTVYNKAKEYGVYGYVLKEHAITELRQCLEEVQKGNHYASGSLSKSFAGEADKNAELSVLTFSERKIVELISLQRTNSEIAELLFMSEKAIEAHRSTITEKLGLPKDGNVLVEWTIAKKNMGLL